MPGIHSAVVLPFAPALVCQWGPYLWVCVRTTPLVPRVFSSRTFFMCFMHFLTDKKWRLNVCNNLCQGANIAPESGVSAAATFSYKPINTYMTHIVSQLRQTLTVSLAKYYTVLFHRFSLPQWHFLHFLQQYLPLTHIVLCFQLFFYFVFVLLSINCSVQSCT